MSKNQKNPGLKELKAVVEAKAVAPVSIRTRLQDVFALDYTKMDQATAHRAEAIRLQEVLDVLQSKVGKYAKQQFEIGKAAAKAKEEATAFVDSDSELNKLRVWLKDHGREAEWDKQRLIEINEYVVEKVGQENIDILNTITRDFPGLKEEIEALKGAIEREKNLADELVNDGKVKK